jgi:crotonobetainyl-CoA:carnitine CoA-transferase CaiB-like acyl-CoA transferase
MASLPRKEAIPPAAIPRHSSEALGPLAGLRILELGTGIAVSLCGRLLADAGAEVVKLEPPGGDAERTRAPFAGKEVHIEKGLPFLYLNAGKRSIVLDPAREKKEHRLEALLRVTDVLIEGSRPMLATWGYGPEQLEQLNRGVIHTTISPFGYEGPYRDFRAEELTLYALGGLMYHIGAYDREPIKHGPAQAQYLAGLNAAAGTLLALLARDHDGAGQRVDVSAQECVALLLGALELSQYAYTGGVARREAKSGPNLNNIQPCADGYVVPVAVGADWAMMAHLLDAPELLEPRFATAPRRQRQAQELSEILRARLAGRSRFTLFHEAQALGLAWGLVQGPVDLVQCPQLAARGFWAEIDHPVAGRLRLPGPAYRSSRTPAEVRGPAPLLGEHTDEIFHSWTRAANSRQGDSAERAGPSGRLPLAGLRVVDASRVWAMPFATGLLGDMGAEVIKVEVITHLDTRTAEPFLHNDPSQRFWEHSGIFNSLNRGKRSVTLDLQTEDGRQLYRELVATADVLVENNRPGVMQRLGLDYERLRQLRPDLIMLSNSGYGQTGPWRHYGAIALSLEPTTGLSYFTGYAGGPPVRWSWFTDFPACVTAVYAICGALHHRNRTGEGQFIDLAMYEVGVSLLGEELLDYMVNGVDPPRRGNRHPEQAPHGCYRCAADDAWITIAVTHDDEWRALCTAMGRPDLQHDVRFRSAGSRKAHEDELDALIEAWTTTQDRYQAMEHLQAAGVAAGVVQTTRDLFADPQLAERGFFERVDHGEQDPALGVRPYVGRTWHLSRTPGLIQRPAPRMGEHNAAILGGLLGVSEAALARLAAEGVIGNSPHEGTPRPEVTAPAERIAQGRWAAWDPDFEQRLGLRIAKRPELLLKED